MDMAVSLSISLSNPLPPASLFPGPAFGCNGSGPHSTTPRMGEVLWSQCGVKSCLVDRHDVLSK